MQLEQSWHHSPTQAQRESFFSLMNLLARPALAAGEAAALAHLVSQSSWQPLPLPALHREVLPLVRANAEAAGVCFTKLFAASEDNALPTAADCAKAFFARRQRLAELAAALRAGGVDRAVLVKGAGVSACMPNPALRLMCDIDIVLSRESLLAAHDALESAGWKRCFDASAGYRHSSGWTADFQVPATPLGEALLAGAVPVAPGEFFLLPPAELHAALLGAHCFQGHGERIWRDVADFRSLQARGPWCATREEQALQFADASGHGAAVRAFFNFARNPVEPVSSTTSEVADRIALLQQMARESTSEILLHLVRQGRRPMLSVLGGLLPKRRAHAPAAPAPTPASTQAPRGLYQIPKSQRLGLAMRFMAASLVSREPRRLLQLARRQHRLVVPSFFSSPKREVTR